MRRQSAQSRLAFPGRPSVSANSRQARAKTVRTPHCSPSTRPSRGGSLSRFCLTLFLFCSNLQERWTEAHPHPRPIGRTDALRREQGALRRKTGRALPDRHCGKERRRTPLLKRTRNGFGPFEAMIFPAFAPLPLPPGILVPEEASGLLIRSPFERAAHSSHPRGTRENPIHILSKAPALRPLRNDARGRIDEQAG
jgi:hypothetical protein